MASHLGIPLQELKRKTTSTEFVEWMAFMELDFNLAHREDYYLAQIAAEVFRAIAKNPKRVRLTDYLLEFQKRQSARNAGTKEGLKSRIDKTKKFFFNLVGYKPK